MPIATLHSIYRHPVKSLGAERLDRVKLTAGAALPGDRRFAIAHGKSNVADTPDGWASCDNFLRIANIPVLARPRLSFDPQTDHLRLEDEDQTLNFDLGAGSGRAALAAWAGERAGSIRAGPYRTIRCDGVSFSDSDDQAPSIMSLASLRDLSQRVGAPLDPRRFRGNLWIDGPDLKPWCELEWTGRALSIGAARLRIIEPIERCRATAADPETGIRADDPLPALRARSGEPLFGVVAEVIQSGEVAQGDPVTL